MERYIEVIGEGQFVETARTFITELNFEVRATKEETALGEAADLCDDALSILCENGITREEITDGGIDVGRPWYWKKQVGQTVSRRVIIKVNDLPRLHQALATLEPLHAKNKERRAIAVHMRQPEFDESPQAKSEALAQAYADAQAKATRIASAMNCALGQTLQFEEGGWSKRNSGFSGDEDWMGDDARFVRRGGAILMAGAAASEEPELQKPTRMIFVKCRVRFAVEER